MDGTRLVCDRCDMAYEPYGAESGEINAIGTLCTRGYSTEWKRTYKLCPECKEDFAEFMMMAGRYSDD